MWAAAWSPDGDQIAFTGAPDSVYFWDLNTDRIAKTESGHFELLPSISWNPSGTRVLTADARGTLKLWDPKTQNSTLTLIAPKGESRCAVWSPDGKRIATATDQTITIWDATNGYELSNRDDDAIVPLAGLP